MGNGENVHRRTTLPSTPLTGMSKLQECSSGQKMVRSPRFSPVFTTTTISGCQVSTIRAAIVSVLAFSFLAVFSPAAFAGAADTDTDTAADTAAGIAGIAGTGSFPWTASFDGGLKSRNWTQKSGTTTIASNISCTGPVQVYYMRLYRDERIDDQVGSSVEFACGRSQQYSFSVPKSGSYYFKLTKANDGGHDSGKGTVTYPSS